MFRGVVVDYVKDRIAPLTDKVPESTRRYVHEHHHDLEYVLKHGSSLKVRAYAGGLLIRGLSDPEIDQVINDLKGSREVLQRPQLPLRASRKRLVI